jgi:hypothetical protein
MKLQLLTFALLSACAAYGAQVKVQTMVKMPIVHFKYEMEKLENGTRETKTIEHFTIELAPEVHKAVCTSMTNVIDSSCFNDTFGKDFKAFIAKTFEKDVDSFILTTNIFQSFSGFWGCKKDNETAKLFSNYCGEVYCLAIYDRHP